MKVAFLLERMDPRRGGMETSVTEFIREIRALGVELEVIAETAAPDLPFPVRVLGRAGSGRTGRYASFLRRADALIKQGDWDLVHAVTPCLSCDVYQPRAGVAKEALARTIAARSSWFGKKLRSLSAHFNPKQKYLAKVERQLLTGPNPPYVAALSGYMRRQIESAYRFPTARVRDIFNGVTAPLPAVEERRKIRARCRSELGLDEQSLAAIFVGHNFRRKGLGRLLEALALPAASQWRLIVLGKESSAAYQKQAKKLKLGSRIAFLGSRKDVRDLYLAADACVLPTYYDPCSRTILEALSLGLPAITTRFDGSADCIEPGRHGFILSAPEATDELAGYLKRLTAKQERERMSSAAFELRPRLTMRRHAEEMRILYEEIMTSER